MNNNEQFTFETLAKFYTDAAKSGGMEYEGLVGMWLNTNGPNLGSLVREFRLRPAPPIVRWVIKFYSGNISRKVFNTEKDANTYKESMGFMCDSTMVIRMVEDQS